MSYYNHVGVPPPQGYPMDAYAKAGMDGHHHNHHQHAPPPPPPPMGYPAHPYAQPYGYAPAPAYPPYAPPPPPPPPRSNGPSFAQGCLAALCCCCLLDACF